MCRISIARLAACQPPSRPISKSNRAAEPVVVTILVIDRSAITGIKFRIAAEQTSIVGDPAAPRVETTTDAPSSSSATAAGS
jgi:hypothetical protein